jgi:hypothetical protein
MKNVLRFASLALSLALGGCATSPNGIAVTVECEPAGAALYSGNTLLGYCDSTQFSYALSEQFIQSGDLIIEPLVAKWISGATLQSDRRIRLANGRNQYMRLSDHHTTRMPRQTLISLYNIV